ncbi:Mn(2+) uptake NRAMP transporter MntH [Glaciihabitans sp. INWT7]|uniref:Nramp family divalent metal transporter n=1 Tax=Glaciihabitans sp. INWT7 TaxID=2596912 RepID=UPI0016243D6F|nr:Nramp family divalent metal transporter [Glaciihabitans sp. INWT7]QNE46270.1 Mn(2+) uptake NRAMP transporter MntH [Glaciihabitans sp. INWT7]
MTATARSTRSAARGLFLLGPAFVAAIAYVDPGNVAANISGGSKYGYLLVWVLVSASLMAALIQYHSAKLGLVSGRSLPELLGDRMGHRSRRLFWAQAELVAAATDLAEVIGGAIALNLLFGLPLFVGGIIVGAVSLGLLAVQSRYGQRPFESVIIGLLAIIAVGFLAGLFITPPDGLAVLGGLVPRFEGSGSVLLAASMLGATVMPHAIYVHSALARDRHGHVTDPEARRRILRITRWDVFIALGIAGLVNVGMLLLAAVNLRGIGTTDTIAGAHAAIGAALGPGIALVFAIGLLASGLASTSVGSYAGATIMAGLLKRRIPVFVRRLITLVPAVALLAAGIDPTWALVVSQVFLSFGIPFALIPLLRLTNDHAVMGEQANRRPARWAMSLIVVLVIALNLALIWLTITG